ncbi:hypothetical protein [Cochlodiniinecator piscidefendens]|uniref:hypothetical protein n=1 Tax=Cochlodiniinecator piscidefendens TaxID=2715756 RepID=UPI00140988F9|nr:hypothetical protein [Cochlodiniinecator piscidefendens]
MADGDLSMLNSVTQDPAQQQAIAYKVMELEAKYDHIGTAQEVLQKGLELHDPAPGHEQMTFSVICQDVYFCEKLQFRRLRKLG